jgi:hypothetical protein
VGGRWSQRFLTSHVGHRPCEQRNSLDNEDMQGSRIDEGNTAAMAKSGMLN